MREMKQSDNDTYKEMI